MNDIGTPVDFHTYSVDLVRRAGALLRGKHADVAAIMQKGSDPRDEVTLADHEINTFLTTEILAQFPTHSIGSEEAAYHKGTDPYTWLIDPIDGTSNFARNIPHFSVSLSLMRGDVPIVSALYNPSTDELFSFDENRGAFLGTLPIKTSILSDIKNAQVFYHIGRRQELWDWGVTTMRSLLEVTKKIKDPGASSLDLAFLAAGRVDVVLYGTMTTRDIAGAIGMVRKAGGEVYALPSGVPVEFTDAPQTILAVARESLKDQLLPALHLDLLLP